MNNQRFIFLLFFLCFLIACNRNSSTGVGDAPEACSGPKAGGHIEYFEVVDTYGTEYNLNTLQNNPINLIVIFPRPCAPCSPKIQIWNQAAILSCNDVQKFGIVLDKPEQAVKLAEKKTWP